MMKVHVALSTGKIITLEENGSSKIRHVKEKIQAKEGISCDKQLLLVKTEERCRELTDDCTLFTYSNSTSLFITILELQVDFMQVYVENNDETYTIHGISPLDTVGELIKKFFKKMTLRLGSQQQHGYLTYQQRKLQISNTVSYYSIENGSKLAFHKVNYQSVRVMSSERCTFCIIVNLYGTVEDLKDLIRQRDRHLQLIPNTDIRLVCGSMTLDDRKTLCKYDIDQYSRIFCLVRASGGGGLKLFVKTMTGKILCMLYLNPNDSLTIENLKCNIQTEINVPPHHQKLEFDGQLLKDYCTMCYYNISFGDTVYLSVIVGIDVYIKTRTGKTIILCMNLSDTVAFMMNEIQNKLEFLSDQHKLIFAGQILNKEYTLSYYGIQANSKFYLVLKEGETIEIFFISQAELKYFLIFKVHGLETIKDLKEKLQQQEGIPIDQQKLLFDGHILENGCTLLDCGIKNETTLILEDTSWVIPRSQIFLDHEEVVKRNFGYFTKAMFKGCVIHVKCLDKIKDNDCIVKFWAKKMEISFHCHHSNIVKFMGGIVEHPIIAITELMDITLHVALSNGRATPNHIYSVSMDVARGLLYLHSNLLLNQPFIHGNIIPDNVLLKASGIGWKAKLSYLGCVHTYDKNHISVAPEVRIAREESVKMDVYSFGMLLVEMTMRAHDPSQEELRKWPHFKPIIEKCIIQNPNKRPSMKEVVDQLE